MCTRARYPNTTFITMCLPATTPAQVAVRPKPLTLMRTALLEPQNPPRAATMHHPEQATSPDLDRQLNRRL